MPSRTGLYASDSRAIRRAAGTGQETSGNNQHQGPRLVAGSLKIDEVKPMKEVHCCPCDGEPALLSDSVSCCGRKRPEGGWRSGSAGTRVMGVMRMALLSAMAWGAGAATMWYTHTQEPSSTRIVSLERTMVEVVGDVTRADEFDYAAARAP